MSNLNNRPSTSNSSLTREWAEETVAKMEAAVEAAADALALIESLNRPLEERLMDAIAEFAPETGNYTPLYLLRERFSLASRQELDEALYALVREDRVELSALVEARHYAAEQIEAGIPQPCGGPLFFAMVA